jgi:hypothetical protein
MKQFWPISAFAVLSACAVVPKNAPPYSRAPDPPPGTANVYIYRIGAYPTARAPTVAIDNKPIFDPPERSYTVIVLPEGRHEFKVDWAWDTGWPDLTFPVAVESQTSLYIKISGSFTQSGLTYEAGSYARRVDQTAAELEMTKCCRYLTPKQ